MFALFLGLGIRGGQQGDSGDQLRWNVASQLLGGHRGHVLDPQLVRRRETDSLRRCRENTGRDLPIHGGSRRQLRKRHDLVSAGAEPRLFRYCYIHHAPLSLESPQDPRVSQLAQT